MTRSRTTGPLSRASRLRRATAATLVALSFATLGLITAFGGGYAASASYAYQYQYDCSDPGQYQYCPSPNTTSTSVSCAPASVQVGHQTTCTATVTDTGPNASTTPGGNVGFTTSGAGTFSGGGSCTLSGGGASASCHVDYTPSATGPHTITATYGGDTGHTGSSNHTTITAFNALSGGKATCNGISSGSPKDVVVPRGAHCTLLAGTQVGHDVQVQPGGSLDDQGANVGHDIKGDHPQGIGIRGGTIGHDVSIEGVTGAGPGTGGHNFICNTNVSGNVSVKKGAAAAGAFVIGDPPDCSGHPSNTIGGNLNVEDNANHVDVSENRVGKAMQVKNNKGGTVVSGNQVTGDATCQGNKPPATGSGNTAHTNHGCPP